MTMMKFLNAVPYFPGYVNDTDAYVPEFWANESLAILEENMVMGNLVHRDFEPIIQSFGDVVNTRRPGEFLAVRKTNDDSVTIQNATATNVQVPLNQQIHVSFMIRDGEESKSFKSLVDEYMFPAMLAQARIVDQILLGQAYQYLANVYGLLGGLSSSNAVQYITGIRNKMNIKKAYMDGRNLVLTPNSETSLLNNSQFTDANRIGDDGTALREASLGRKLGFDMWMCQNGSSVATGNSTLAGAINGGNLAAGSTVLTVNNFTGAVTTGNWLTVAGDMTPQRITAHSETLGNTTSITISPGLRSAIVNTAVVTTYTAGQVNQSVSPTGYAIGWSKPIVYDTFTVDPQVGQLVAFGTATDVYSIVQVDTVGKTILLDRPLVAAIADNALINIGPPGEYNFAFHRNALALVVRPMAMPRDGIGARSAVVNAGGLSMRATITYNGEKQGTLVTLDMLLGVAVLDTNLGGIMFG
jgi:hypothetical protein